MAALYHRLEVELHVVAQVIEAEFVVGAISDVGSVGLLAVGVCHVGLDDADGKSEKPVDGAHPFGVSAGQIVVGRYHMHTAALEGVEVDGQRGDQGLALAGLHLGYLPLVQDDAADELNIERAHVDSAPGRLAGDGKSLDEQVVQ